MQHHLTGDGLVVLARRRESPLPRRVHRSGSQIAPLRQHLRARVTLPDSSMKTFTSTAPTPPAAAGATCRVGDAGTNSSLLDLMDRPLEHSGTRLFIAHLGLRGGGAAFACGWQESRQEAMRLPAFHRSRQQYRWRLHQVNGRPHSLNRSRRLGRHRRQRLLRGSRDRPWSSLWRRRSRAYRLRLSWWNSRLRLRFRQQRLYRLLPRGLTFAGDNAILLWQGDSLSQKDPRSGTGRLIIGTSNT